MTEKRIENLMLESLNEFEVGTKYLRGQGYNGVAEISRKYNNVQA